MIKAGRVGVAGGWVCALALILSGCGAYWESPARRGSSELQPLKLVVAGSGMTEEEPPLGIQPLNTAQGSTIRQGAEWGQQSKRFLGTKAKDLLKVEYRNDFGDTELAAVIAKEIALDPAVLAVIGHATSATTRRAAAIYAQAGIPVLVPSASSPIALCSSGNTPETCVPLTNSFRLIPNDVDVQAPAVALAVAKEGHTRPYLLVDTSPNAAAYSRHLANEVKKYLETPRFTASAVEKIPENPDFSAIVRKVSAFKPDAIIFCGYQDRAEDLLKQMAEVYEGRILAAPDFFLTDGCLADDLKTHGFPRVYVTFARGMRVCPDLRDDEQDMWPKDAKILREKAGSTQIAFQEYGHDAVLMVAQAVEECREEGTVSRACLVDRLTATPEFVGACDVYALEDGENQYAEYYLHVFDYGTRVNPRRLDPKEIKRFAQLIKN